MSKASTSQERIQWGAEPSYLGSISGVTPQELRYISHDLDQATEYTLSPEIDSTAQRIDASRTFRSVASTITTAFSMTTYEAWLTSLMRQSSITTAGTGIVGASDISFLAIDNSVNSGAGSLTAGNGFNQGRMVQVVGGLNDGKVYKIVANPTTAKAILSGGQVIPESTGTAITLVPQAYIVNGTSLSSIAVERELRDLPGNFLLYRGCAFNTAGFAFRPRGPVTVQWGFIGSREDPGSVTAFAGSPTAPTTTSIINGVTDVYGFFEGGPSGNIASTSGGEKLTVTGASTTTEELTVSTNHKMETGDWVVIRAIVGTTEANGVFTIVKTAVNKFTLKDMTGAAVNLTNAYTSGGTVIRLSRPLTLTSADINVSNNIIGTEVIGFLGHDDIIGNTFEVTGRFGLYLSDLSHKRKYLDFDRVSDETALLLVAKDSAGLWTTWDMPRCKFSGAPLPNPGLNNPYQIEFGFTAYKHREEGFTMRMSKG